MRDGSRYQIMSLLGRLRRGSRIGRLALAAWLVATLGLAGCNSGSGGGGSSTLASISVSPVNASVAKGLQRQLTATGHYADGSTKDLSSEVTWRSSSTAVATLSAAGLLTAATPGKITVTAGEGNITGQTTLTVTAATLTTIGLSPSVTALPAGEDLQLTATGVFSDGTTQDITQQAAWTSAATATATVGSGSGLVHGVAVGSTDISASLDGITAQLTLRVSSATLVAIDVAPIDPSLAAGTMANLTATADYSDGSTRDVTGQVAWSSTDTKVATVVSGTGYAGTVTAVATGSVAIKAALGSVTGAARLTVTAAVLTGITVTPASPSVAAGYAVQLHATGSYSDGSTQDLTAQVGWQSGDITIAEVCAGGGCAGLVSAVSAGSVTITASYGSSVSGSTTVTVTAATLQSIQVTPVNPSVNADATLQLAAAGTYSDGSQQDLSSQVTWSSSDGGVATVSNAGGSQGLLSGIAQGQVTVQAELGGVTGTTTVTITADPNAPVSATIVAQPNLILDDGSDAAQLSVTVRPADPSGSIPDGTQVDFVVSDGSAQLSAASATTVNGVATLAATSTSVGMFTVTATVHGTAISRSVQIYAVADFADAMVTSGSAITVVNNGVVQQGSEFDFTVVNYSNRSFGLNQYQLTNGGSVVTTITNGQTLNNNLLPGSSGLQVRYTLQQDTPNNGFVATFSLSDTPTGTSFSVSKTYTLQ